MFMLDIHFGFESFGLSVFSPIIIAWGKMIPSRLASVDSTVNLSSFLFPGVPNLAPLSDGDSMSTGILVSFNVPYWDV